MTQGKLLNDWERTELVLVRRLQAPGVLTVRSTWDAYVHYIDKKGKIVYVYKFKEYFSRSSAMLMEKEWKEYLEQCKAYDAQYPDEAPARRA